MLKVIGSLLIILPFGMLGILKSFALKKRYDTLGRLIEAFILIQHEISYGKTETKEMLCSIGTEKKLPFLCDIANAANAKALKECVTAVLSENKLDILGTDKEILVNFFNCLGTLNTKSQLSEISHTKKLLELARDNAFNNYNKFSKLYAEAGFLCGAMFAILLF